MEALAERPPARLTNSQGEALLSDREEQIVALVAEGMTNREISCELRLSENTIKNYLFRIFDKLGVSNRSELIIYTYSKKNNAA